MILMKIFFLVLFCDDLIMMDHETQTVYMDGIIMKVQGRDLYVWHKAKMLTVNGISFLWKVEECISITQGRLI